MNRSEHEARQGSSGGVDREVDDLLMDSDWMRRLSRRLVFDADVAEDVFQDAWVAALEGRARVRGNFGGFVAGVIRRLSSAHHRGEARRRRRESIAGDIGKGSESPDDVADLTARVERQRMLSSKVLTLPENYRRVVLLRYFEGLSQREIAARTGLPKATVNSQLTRALAILREDLDREHDGDRAQWVGLFAPLASPSSLLGTLSAGVLIMKTKHLALAGFVLLASAVIPIAVWSGDDPPPVARIDAEAPPETGIVAKHDLSSATRVVAGHGVLERPSDSAAPRESVLPEVTRRIRALFDVDRAPASGAEVYFIGHRSIGFSGPQSRDAIRNRAGYGRPFEEMIQSIAWRTVTDARGEALIPGDDDGMLVVISGDAMARDRVRLSGGAGADERPETLEVTLEPVRKARTLVVNGRGEPVAGVPVELVVRPSEQGPGLKVAMRRTDEEGRVDFTMNPYKPMLEGIDSEVSVGLALALNAPVARRVHPEGGPEVTVLTLPECASVRVIVEDTAGNPVPDDTLVRLSVADGSLTGGAESGGTESGDTGSGDTESLVESFEVTRNGVARFKFVGVGMALRASAWPKAGLPPQDALGSSPASPDTEVDVQLRLDTRTVLLTSILSDEHGRPWADNTIWIAGVADLPMIAATDMDGRFETEIPADVNPGDPIEVTLNPDGRTLSLTVELPSPDAESGMMDLGSQVIRRGRVIAAGTVMDEAGQPVSEVWVNVARKGDPAVGEPVWVGLNPGSARTDSIGRFEFYEAPSESPAWLFASGGGQSQSDPIPYRASNDLTIVLPVKVRFSGRILVDPTIAADRVTVAFWDESKGEPGPLFVGGWNYASVKPDGKIVSPRLSPGSYTMAFASTIDDRDPMRVTGVQVRSENASDPRVSPMDLRGHYAALNLRVRDEIGNSVQGSAFAMYPNGHVLQLGSTRRSLVVPIDERPDGIVIEADGYFLESIAEVEGTHDIVLRRGFEVELEWPVGEPFPAAPLEAKAKLVPANPAPVAGGSRAAYWVRGRGPLRATFGEDRIARVRVLGAGEHSVTITIEHDRSGYVDIEWLTSTKRPPTVFVNPPTQGASARFPAPIPVGSAASAIEELGAER